MAEVYGVYMSAPPTAERIASAARRLFEAHGAEGMSMRRVSAAVGITPMAIYRHYRDSTALVDAVAQQGFLELAAHLRARRGRAAPLRYLATVMDAYVKFALDRPRMFDLMFLEARPGARRFPGDFRAGRSPTGNLLAETVEEAMNDGSLRRGDVWEVALAVWAQVHGLVALHRAGRVAMSPARFRSLCRRSLERLLRGLAS